ncbi:MAG: hypothetical protein H6825_05140 [Planctomycetes bacterium]|nr:hypothetical protein [Planctomycetota bacterium]
MTDDTRLDAEQLAFDDDGRALHAGAPFTGVAVERDDDGALLAEDTYVDGLRHGPSRMFHPTGELAEEGVRRRGAWHGTVEVWNVDGTQAEEARYAYGICLESFTWDASGELVEHFQLDQESDMMRLVERCRADDEQGGDAGVA